MDSRFSENGHFWLKRAIFKTFSGRQAMNTLCRFSGLFWLAFVFSGTSFVLSKSVCRNILPLTHTPEKQMGVQKPKYGII
jgi:hypothetical protein